MDSVITIPAYNDNYIYLWQYEKGLAAAIDPCSSGIVMHILTERSLKLTNIFVTHGHFDHTGGIQALKSATGCEVTGPDDGIPYIDKVVEDGEVIEAGRYNLKVIGTPGHTYASVCYYVTANNRNEKPVLFTGDTLFVGGCGRVFGGGYGIMWQSLQKLAALPEETLVYCGHDYTIENYEFALSIQQKNKQVMERLQQVREKVEQGSLTVPSSIGEEKCTNIFLRSNNPEVKKALNMSSSSAKEIFAELRRCKDLF